MSRSPGTWPAIAISTRGYVTYRKTVKVRQEGERLMAKRKTARPASRTRAPGAARARQGGRATTTKRQSKPHPARKGAGRDRTGARSTKKTGRAVGSAARPAPSKKAAVQATTKARQRQ